MELTHQERLARLALAADQGRVIRAKWADVYSNKACLLAWLSPEAASAKSASACPPTVLPQWFACMTPFMADNVPIEMWQWFVARYAQVACMSHRLDARGWDRAHRASICGVMREAMVHASASPVDAPTTRVIAEVVAWLERGAPTDDQSDLRLEVRRAIIPNEPQSTRIVTAIDRLLRDEPISMSINLVTLAGHVASASMAMAPLFNKPRLYHDTCGRIADVVLDAIEAECSAIEVP